MNKKELAKLLSTLKPFSKPKATLEQYATPSELAATLLWHACLNGDIEGKHVIDLGCGPGIFGIGAGILGAEHVTFVDIDEEALKTAEENIALIPKELLFPHEFIHKDAQHYEGQADTLIQNPPFGIQQKHADKTFLEKAMKIAPTIYTIHTTDSAAFIQQFAIEHGYTALCLQENASFPIKATQKYHTKQKHEVSVGLWKLNRKP